MRDVDRLKAAFFHGLDSLDHSDDDEAPFAANRESSLNRGPSFQHVLRRSQRNLQRPQPQHRQTAPTITTTTTTTTSINPVVAPLRRANTAPEPATKTPPPPVKSKPAMPKPRKMQPVERQVFKGLVFFFIKPDIKRPERKMRMDKAREYGATIATDFDDTVTHIIADKELKYNDVTKFLKLSVIPSTVPVTGPLWPGDCIKYKKLVDPTDFWYQPPPSSLLVEPRPRSKRPLETPDSTPPEPIATSPKPYPAPSAQSAPTTAKDALDEAIEECLAGASINVEDLLGDDPDDPSVDHTHSSEPESSDSDTKRSPKRRKPNDSNWQSHFQCMPQNPTGRTIQVLEEMMHLYDDMKDQWRTRSYRIAISSLKKTQGRFVATYEDAMALSGVGDRLAKKIVEIVTTDRLQRLEYAKLDPSDQLLKLFHARKFVAAGYKTLDDVKSHATLTAPQSIGLAHYHDFQQRIPRAEVAQHGEIVAQALQQLDPTATSHIMGSYRRGNPDCGDIDIIITKPGAAATELRSLLDGLVAALTARDFLMCGLAIARHDDGTKWHGASRVGADDAPWRRIDFLAVPGEELGAAFLYFTGNDVFNRSMRLLASKKGMRLNQRGLYADVMRGEGRRKMNEGALLESKSEEKIFEILGVPYRPPEHRIC
ncbi:hypothetical protein DRE_02134 [Drechslerella stenobrocha 248]|uniref:DNA polymerase n=1 Tax=Drechslerella stenobrocha 248 TaxID=1043628 RepID=W7IGN4_9PEZI|nr:hypothetical protein DRE_02134 [Drechslerella stenobrocha 248]